MRSRSNTWEDLFDFCRPNLRFLFRELYFWGVCYSFVCVDILATVISLCLLSKWLWLWGMQGFYFCGALLMCVDILATVISLCLLSKWLWLWVVFISVGLCSCVWTYWLQWSLWGNMPKSYLIILDKEIIQKTNGRGSQYKNLILKMLYWSVCP